MSVYLAQMVHVAAAAAASFLIESQPIDAPFRASIHFF